MTRSFELTRISQIGIPSQAISRSVEFYRDRLGVRFLFESPNAAFFACDGIRLMISTSKAPPDPSSIIYFEVEDIHKAAETLQSRGVAFDREPHLVAKMPAYDLWMAFFRDPDGNVLALMAENRRYPEARP